MFRYNSLNSFLILSFVCQLKTESLIGRNKVRRVSRVSDMEQLGRGNLTHSESVLWEGNFSAEAHSEMIPA